MGNNDGLDPAADMVHNCDASPGNLVLELTSS
jgi:hypothetical protein